MEFKPYRDGWELSGDITAKDAPLFSALTAAIPAGKPVTIYLPHLTNVSSSAIRLWLGFKNDLKARGNTLTLAECSSGFVDMANVYDEIAKGLTISSLFFPVQCVACEATTELLLTAERARSGALALPRCTACGSEMHAFIDTEDYFGCLGSG